MIVTYDPETQGRSLSDSEIEKLIDIDPHQTVYSGDEPELTDELVQRMKQSECPKNLMTSSS